MRGVYVPFSETADIALLGAAGKIPRSFPNGTIDQTWIDVPPPAGANIQFGFIGSPLPVLPSNMKGKLGYETTQDQVCFWTGSQWNAFA